jgi:biopolymer transport protein ExbD
MKLPGYRSGTGWKKRLATLVYGILVIVVILFVMDPFTQEAMDLNQPTAQVANDSPVHKLEVQGQNELSEQYIFEFTRNIHFTNMTLPSIRERLTTLKSNADQIASIREANDEVFQMVGQFGEMENVPRQYERVHAVYVRGARDVEQFHAMVAEALDFMEAGDQHRAHIAIEEAIPFIESAEAYFREASREMDGLGPSA